LIISYAPYDAFSNFSKHIRNLPKTHEPGRGFLTRTERGYGWVKTVKEMGCQIPCEEGGREYIKPRSDSPGWGYLILDI
jgi:hypothetical protein